MSSLYCYIQEGPLLPTFRIKICILDQSVRANELTLLQFSHGYHNKAFSYSFNCYSNLYLLKRLNGLFLYVTVGIIAFFSLLRESMPLHTYSLPVY